MSKFRVSHRPIFPRAVAPRELFYVAATREEAEQIADQCVVLGMHDVQITEVVE